jgi:hypothetical protein
MAEKNNNEMERLTERVVMIYVFISYEGPQKRMENLILRFKTKTTQYKAVVSGLMWWRMHDKMTST